MTRLPPVVMAVSMGVALVACLARAEPAGSGDSGTPPRPERLLHGAHEESMGGRERRFLRPRFFPDGFPQQRWRDTALTQIRGLVAANQGIRLLMNPNALVPCQWTSTGPTNVSGRVTDIAINPHSPATMFVTTVGGIWRTRDRGRSWARVSDVSQSDMPRMTPGVFGAVAISTVDTNEILVAGGDPNRVEMINAGGPGLWRSSDGGDTWKPEGPPALKKSVVFRIRYAKTTGDAYVATSLGLWWWKRTGTDAGWSRLANMTAACSDLVLDESRLGEDPGTWTHCHPVVYAGISMTKDGRAKGVWRYDGRWGRRSNGISSRSGHISLAICSTSTNVLLARVTDMTGDTLLGVYRTEDAGCGWECKMACMQEGSRYARYNAALAIDPLNPDTLYSGGVRLWRSTDGGISWNSLSDGPERGYDALHDDQHAIAFSPDDPRILFVGNDGGIWRCDMAANSWHWENRSHGLNVTEAYSVATSQSPAPGLAASSQDNGIPVTFGNRTFYKSGIADGDMAAFDARNVLATYVSMNRVVWRQVVPLPGTDDTLRAGPTPDSTGHVVPPVIADVDLAEHALACLADSDFTPLPILVTWDGGTRGWQALRSSPELPCGTEFTCLAVEPRSGFSVFYAGVAARKQATAPTALWSTTDSGATWTEVRRGLPPGLRPNAIATAPGLPGRAYAAFGGTSGGAVLVTPGYGRTWVKIPMWGFPTRAPATGIAVDSLRSTGPVNVIYVSTSVGVVRGEIMFRDSMPNRASWTRFDEGLPDGVQVNDITLNVRTGVLTIATMGYGIYQRRIGLDAECRAVEITIRDNVFDDGIGRAPSNVSNPENPILQSDGSYKPDDSEAGRLYWWSSPDIRVSDSTVAEPRHRIGRPDHVEFETCPLRNRHCPPGCIVDAAPHQGSQLHIQVINNGTRRSGPVRVTVLAADAMKGFPPLPSNLWDSMTPRGATIGTIAPEGWSLIDHREIAQGIAPEMPAVVTIPWKPLPGTWADPCILAIADCLDDSLQRPATQDVESLVRDHRQIALRKRWAPADSDSTVTKPHPRDMKE